MPDQFLFGFSMGQFLCWLDARAKHETDQTTGQYRRLRLHAYKIITEFGSGMPDLEDWWPLPGDKNYDEKVKKAASSNLSAVDAIRAFGAAFRQ